jgi:Derlin-2/3
MTMAAGIDFLFHIFFLIRYCKSLEEGSFRNRSADFLWMLLLGAAMLTCMAPFAKVQFLGTSLNFMLVYVWSRRNPGVPLSFLGIFTFGAAYLPWVLMAFSVLIGGSLVVDMLGMIAGHTYYYLEDVYPHTHHGRGRRLLKTPDIVKALFPTEAIPRPRQVFVPARRDHQD